MEIALLVNNTKEYRGSLISAYFHAWGSLDNRLAKAYAQAAHFISPENRIKYLYFGSEFCEYRLPNASVIHDFLELCQKDDIIPVFVTPPSCEYGIALLKEDLHYLKEAVDHCEIVVNDFGVLELIHSICPNFEIIFGRILDKTSHDSRILFQNMEAYYGTDGLKFARTPGIISDLTTQALNKYNIVRYEFDLPKVGLEVNKELKCSLYWPYQYMTTGRVCMFRAVQYNGRDKFLVGNEKCAELCSNIQAEFRKPVNGFIAENGEKINDMFLFQRGNTLFYLNTSDNFLENNSIFDRLIFQI